MIQQKIELFKKSFFENSLNSKRIINPILSIVILLFWYCIFLVYFAFPSFATCPSPLAGSGTLGDPCKISTCNDLQNISLELYQNYSIENNINCVESALWWSGTGFNSSGQDRAFEGSLNGRGYNISNLYINRGSSTDKNGLFAAINVTAYVFNVTLINATTIGGSYTGNLIGYAFGGKVSNCTIYNSTVQGTSYIGGAIGYADNVSITRLRLYSSNISNSIHGSYFGGLIGYFNSGNITNSSFTGNISSLGDNIGGLVGFCAGNITHSFSIANVSGNDFIGGLVGYQFNSTIYNSTSTIYGAVSGRNYVGSLIGVVNGTVNYSNSYVEVSAIVNGISFSGFVGNNSGIISNSSLTIQNTSIAAITFFNWNTTGNITGNITLRQNFVENNIINQPGFNKSANITFYNYPSYGRGNPKLLYNGTMICNSSSYPSCYNFTSLDAATVIFNVSSWSNYTIVALAKPAYINISNASELELRYKNMTFSSWIKPASNGTLYSKGILNSDEADAIYLISSATPNKYTLSAKLGHCIFNSTTQISKNTWTNIIVVKTTLQPTVVNYTFYVNNVAQTKTDTWNYCSADDSLLDLLIGCAEVGTDGIITNCYNGGMDDIRLYNRSLNHTEVNQVYQNSTLSNPGLLVWYNLDVEKGLVNQSFNSILSTNYQVAVTMKNESGFLIETKKPAVPSNRIKMQYVLPWLEYVYVSDLEAPVLGVKTYIWVED